MLIEIKKQVLETDVLHQTATIILLWVLQQRGSVRGSRVMLGVAQPALSVVLHPVRPVAVSQQEEVGLLSSQQQIGSWNTRHVSSTLRNALPMCLADVSVRLSAHLCCLPARSHSSWRACPAWSPLNLQAEQPPPPSATGGREPRPSWWECAPEVETKSHKSHLTFFFFHNRPWQENSEKKTLFVNKYYSALQVGKTIQMQSQ